MNELKLRYRGRDITTEDIAFINDLIACHPGASRRALSKLLCEAWSWRQPNGELRDMVCRSLMLVLHRGGHIELPPPRIRAINNAIARHKIKPQKIDTTPLRSSLSQLRPLTLRQVRRRGGVRRSGGEENLFNYLLQEHHYLGYSRPVGEYLKYLALSGNRPVACFAWASAARRLAPRDRFIGWGQEARRENIHLIAYNTRYLILPWVEVGHLASHLLGSMARRLSKDWEELYGHPIHYLESFIEPGRYRGTSYRAANWHFLGRTTGRGKNDQSGKANRPLKEVLGYPLSKRFRELLSGVQ